MADPLAAVLPAMVLLTTTGPRLPLGTLQEIPPPFPFAWLSVIRFWVMIALAELKMLIPPPLLKTLLRWMMFPLMVGDAALLAMAPPSPPVGSELSVMMFPRI